MQNYDCTWKCITIFGVAYGDTFSYINIPYFHKYSDNEEALSSNPNFSKITFKFPIHIFLQIVWKETPITTIQGDNHTQLYQIPNKDTFLQNVLSFISN